MLNTVNYFLWINICVILVIFGLILTYESNFIQFNVVKMIKALFTKKMEKDSISIFQTLMISLGGKIGVGSISGISLAIFYGGPGTIFWIVIISIIISIITFYEVYLGNYFKEKDFNNIYKGGPSYYIKKGINKKILSYIYTLLIIICYNVFFSSIQANTIMKMTTHIFNINPVVVGIIISFTTLFAIYNGIKNIAKISNILVPIMLFVYVSIAVYICIYNYNKLPMIIDLIIKDAFNIKSFLIGFIPMIMISTKRVIFATECGIGTTAIAASTGNSNPVVQGYIQILGIYIISFIVCLSTAFIILTTNYNLLNIRCVNGIELVIYSFNYHFGAYGNIILYIIIILFCFSTIITCYYNGESSIKSLKINNVKLLKYITVVIIFLGVLINPQIMWEITDFLVGIILLINIFAVYKLKGLVRK